MVGLKKKCRVNKFLFVALLTIAMISAVSAADVAYIVKDEARVQQPIVDVFDELGLSYEVVEDASINSRTNFNQYEIIFIDDYQFNLRNTISYLDVSKYKTIITNPYEGEEYGLTDVDGISSLTANAPLSVIKDNSVIQVYNSAYDNRRRPLSYYYLDKHNIANGFMTVATTYKGGNEILGDVISVAMPGAQLSTGKTTQEKVCFFGIAQSNYWTPAAKEMFKDDCVGFVAFDVACYEDTDCDDNDDYTRDNCVNPGERTSFCENVPIECLSESDCGVDGYVGGEFCTQDGDVGRDYRDYSCLNAGTTASSCVFEDEVRETEQCTDACVDGSCVGFVCEQDSDCGTDGFVGEEMCTDSGDVGREYVEYTCNNPGTLQSSCSDETELRVVEQCTNFCSDGSCEEYTCNEDIDCDDNDARTVDECVNPGSPSSFCRNTEVNCVVDADCGTTGFTGTEYCAADDVKKNYQTANCVNEGTTESYCVVNVEDRTVQECQYACTEDNNNIGTCIRCDSNLDCNDNDGSTTDVCVMPGTVGSYCENEEEEIACNVDSDCGTDGFVGGAYCSTEGDSVRNYKDYTCNNAGTSQSSCSSSTEVRVLEECDYGCSNGQCEEPVIECYTNSDCGSVSYGGEYCSADNVVRDKTTPLCRSPGSASSYCEDVVTTETVEQCTEECSNGQCVDNRIHDVESTNIRFFVGPGNSNEIRNNVLVKGQQYNIVTTLRNNGNFDENPSIDGDVRQGNSEVMDFKYLARALGKGQMQSWGRWITFNLPNGRYEVSVESQIQNDANPGNDEYSEIITVVECVDDGDCSSGQCVDAGTLDARCEEPVIECYTNSDCGSVSYGGEYCSADNVVRDKTVPTCENPGTVFAECTEIMTTETVEQCSESCSNGECVEEPVIECYNNSDCDDGSEYTVDRCVMPGTPNSFCRNTEVNCVYDTDCGETGFVGTEYCSEDDVNKNYQTATCNNAGTLDSYCQVSVEERPVDMCEFACTESGSGASCIRCDENLDCNDGNANTVDTCVMPGTVGSYCENEEEEIACNVDSDCGTDGFIGGEFCTAAPYEGEGAIVNDVVIPDDADCLWAPDAEDKRDLEDFVRNRGDEYVGWAYNNELANITNIRDDGSFLNYIDQTILCYNGRWHTTINGWPYWNLSEDRPWGIVPESSDTVIDKWNIVEDDFWELKWTTDIASVSRNYRTYSCLNAGTTSSSCVYEDEARVIEQCSEDCSDGECVERPGEVYEIVDSSVDTSRLCTDGIVEIRCTVNKVTNSIFPVYDFPNENNPQWLGEQTRRVEGGWEYIFTEEVNPYEIEGNYQVGCYLDPDVTYGDVFGTNDPRRWSDIPLDAIVRDTLENPDTENVHFNNCPVDARIDCPNGEFSITAAEQHKVPIISCPNAGCDNSDWEEQEVYIAESCNEITLKDYFFNDGGDLFINGESLKNGGEVDTDCEYLVETTLAQCVPERGDECVLVEGNKDVTSYFNIGEKNTVRIEYCDQSGPIGFNHANATFIAN